MAALEIVSIYTRLLEAYLWLAHSFFFLAHLILVGAQTIAQVHPNIGMRLYTDNSLTYKL